MLAVTETDFNQVGLTDCKEFEALKSSGKLLFGQLPLLEIDGQKLTQSSAMVQYLARKHNLYGDNPAESALCDMVAFACNDLGGPTMGRPFAEDQEAAVARIQAALDKFGPRLETIAEQQTGTCMVGTRLSYADVMVAEALEGISECIPGSMDQYPKLKAIHARVLALPRVSKYLGSDLRWPKPDAAYAINVNTVLQRPIPPFLRQ